VARKAGRSRGKPVEGFTQAIKLLNQGRVDVVINDSIRGLCLPCRNR
jgi:cystine transport system permease protein